MRSPVSASTSATGQPEGVDRRTPVARAVLAQAGMEVRLLVRSGESLLITFGIPIGVLVFFSVIDVLPTGDERAVDFLVPGVIAISVAATGLVAVAIQTAFERKYGVLKRLGGTPLPRWGFLAAKGMAVAVLLSIQTALVVAIAAGPLGWRPAGGAVIVPVAILLGAITCTAIGLLLAGTLRAEATLAFANALFLVLLVISGVAFDADTLPDLLGSLGRALPVGALAEALRSGFAGDGAALLPLLTLLGWGGAAIAIASRTFRWEP
jgi:ABC-2 type transport system permease protein